MPACWLRGAPDRRYETTPAAATPPAAAKTRQAKAFIGRRGHARKTPGGTGLDSAVEVGRQRQRDDDGKQHDGAEFVL